MESIISIKHVIFPKHHNTISTDTFIQMTHHEHIHINHISPNTYPHAVCSIYPLPHTLSHTAVSPALKGIILWLGIVFPLLLPSLTHLNSLWVNVFNSPQKVVTY